MIQGRAFWGRIVVLFIFVGAVILTAQTAAGQQNAAAPDSSEATEKTPKIKFEELDRDFGMTVQNEKLKHTFTFKNTGTDVLVIEKVKAG